MLIGQHSGARIASWIASVQDGGPWKGWYVMGSVTTLTQSSDYTADGREIDLRERQAVLASPRSYWRFPGGAAGNW